MSSKMNMIMDEIFSTIMESRKTYDIDDLEVREMKYVFEIMMFGITDMMQKYINRTEKERRLLHLIDCNHNLFGMDQLFDTFLAYGLLLEISNNPRRSHSKFKPLSIQTDIEKIINDNFYQIESSVNRVAIRLMKTVLNIISTFENIHKKEFIDSDSDQSIEYKLFKHVYIQGRETLIDINNQNFIQSMIQSIMTNSNDPNAPPIKIVKVPSDKTMMDFLPNAKQERKDPFDELLNIPKIKTNSVH